MKLRKQAPAKALIVAASAGLLAAFYAIVRADPHIGAESVNTAPTPAVDYRRFFAPGAAPANPQSQPELPEPRGRTRAS
jgi:hypothetical protein